MDLRKRAGMIRSVSTLSPRSGIAVPARRSIFSIAIGHLPHVNHFTGNSRRGNHRGAHQQGPARGAALPPLEIAVRRRGADLATFELVGVHRQAHRAPGASPVETGVYEDAIEPFPLCRQTDGL